VNWTKNVSVWTRVVWRSASVVSECDFAVSRDCWRTQLSRHSRTDCITNIRNVYSLKYSDIPKVFLFTPHQVGHGCTNVILCHNGLRHSCTDAVTRKSGRTTVSRPGGQGREEVVCEAKPVGQQSLEAWLQSRGKA
jgi:hypothetical protein